MITSLDEAIRLTDQAIADAEADFPDVGTVDIHHEMVMIIANDCDPPTRIELLRCMLGYDPAEDDW